MLSLIKKKKTQDKFSRIAYLERMKSFKYYCQISFIIDSKDKSLIMSIHQNLIMSKTLIRIIKKIMRGRGYLGVLRFGG